MKTKSRYSEREVRACRRVLLELNQALGEFRNQMALVGGWIPFYLCPDAQPPHTGSIDVDVALDFTNIPEDTYRQFLETLMASGYEQDQEQPFRIYRMVHLDSGEPIRVEVDLLAGEYGGRGKSRRTQTFQDAHPRKARGLDLVFDRSGPLRVELEGEYPDGGRDRIVLQISRLVPFFVMKGMALFSRSSPKDAYDLYYVLVHYPGGLDKIIREFREFGDHGLVREGLGKIRAKFETVDHIGPMSVALFEEVEDVEEQERIKRDAYERMNKLLDALDVAPYEEE